MKSVGTAYWISPNTGATNESVFSALPGGYRDDAGSFSGISNRLYAFFWCATADYNNYTYFAWLRYLSYNGGDVYRYSNHKIYGASVRCLRD
jgi:uncharacterized protein (TIGR02145 family)